MYGLERKVWDMAKWYMFHPIDMVSCKLGRRSGPSVPWQSAWMEFVCNISGFLLSHTLTRKENRKRKALNRPTITKNTNRMKAAEI